MLLDISRSLSRRFLDAPTGIDRVERAYLERFLGEGSRNLALAVSGRTAGVMSAASARRLLSAPPQRPDAIAMLRPWRRAALRDAESAIRRHAEFSGSARSVAGLLRRLPEMPETCLNIGHTNLDDAMLSALSDAGLRLIVMIHDVIPLDFPEFTMPRPRARFAARIRAVSAHAHLVIHISEATRRRTEAAMARAGRVPPGVVIHPGTPPTEPRAGAGDGSFVMLGTIEPRKNHAMILDVWDRLAAGGGAPPLHIVGRRGWNSDEVFARLDRWRARGGPVIEHGALPDREVDALLSRASALLFPSLAEGFGLPMAEAISRGVPVIASDLPVLREAHGQAPEYLPPDAPERWCAAIQQILYNLEKKRFSELTKKTMSAVQKWDEHFEMLETCMKT